MARPRKNKPTESTTSSTGRGKYKRRDLAERIKTFDTAKIMALKAQAEQTIRLISAEGLRRQKEFEAMKDTSILNESSAAMPTTPTKTSPYAGTTVAPANGDMKTTTTSP